jgi:omega-6 fatty acid desaturase (delta-12 desaturase)
MGALVGYREFALVQLPVAALSTIIGVWLFYVQHQFDPTYWEREDRWSYDSAALHGSSYYRLPKILQWATGNIGLHHVHHLHPRIPNYRLDLVLRDNPELAAVPPLTLWGSLRCMRLTLWDEQERKLVPFKAVRGRARGR